MPQWYLPNILIRVFAAQHLSPEERFALNVITSCSVINAALVLRCHKILRYDAVQRIITDVILPQGLQFLVIRGYGVDPIPQMERDEVSPDMSRVHCVPTTLIVAYGYAECGAEALDAMAWRLQQHLMRCSVHRYCRLIRCVPGETDAVEAHAVTDNDLHARRVRVLSAIDVFPMVLGAAQEAAGSDPEKIKEQFLTWLLELQQIIVCRTDYDLPLTWRVTNGVVTCTEAEDWLDRFGVRRYRYPGLNTLPTEVQPSFARVLNHDWRLRYIPRVADAQPWELLFADEGDVVTSAVLRRTCSDYTL